MYGVPEQGNTEIYMMQGNEHNPHLTTPIYEHVESMNGEGMPEYVIDPTMYYSTAANYGYYCTGFESTNEWDDQQRAYGLDGTDPQYAGTQAENMQYGYYTPTYGMSEAAYNPYNPYIPGAVIGADGQYYGTQPYYTVSPYQNSVPSSGYFPVAMQSRPDAIASSSVDASFDTVPSSVNHVTSSASKHGQSSSSVTLAKNPSKIAHGHSQSIAKASDGSRVNSGTNQRVMSYRGNSVGNHGASFTPQSVNDNSSRGRVPSQQNQMKMSLLLSSGLSDFGSNANGRDVGDNNWSKYYQRRPVNDSNGVPDLLSEQNRGPRTNRSKNQFVVRAYTTRAGDCNAQGNIVISADNYNKEDLPLDYENAKFFVIKSYSEDDVHKSIKYNVWSSTPNGNKKLSVAYDEAQKEAAGRAGGCPIFLFFSVNASGQFCGVAEMVGPVDFDKDMDFWQQDKWSGSFPVKWHMIKDVPNTIFRHIILENNEHKPVTNSRDTQEIMHKPGMEMLKLFKNYTPKTSLLDDFMYYENRQKIMLEERARMTSKGNPRAFRTLVDASVPNLVSKNLDKTNSGHTTVDGKIAEPTTVESSSSPNVGKTDGDVNGSAASKLSDIKANNDGMVNMLKIGSLTINPKQTDHKSSMAAPALVPRPISEVGAGSVDIVTVGSMPVKVNGHSNSRPSTGQLTVGSIQLDPKPLRSEKTDKSAKAGIRSPK